MYSRIVACHPDACRLLTAAEITAALGAKPAGGKPGGARVEQGVKAWYCVIWLAVKGRYMANVTVAGELTNPQAMREPVRRLVAQALARLAP